MRTCTLFSAVLALLLASETSRSTTWGRPQPAIAATSATDRRDRDNEVFQTVREAMDEAAGLYNAGKPTESYYRFLGALKSVDRQLNHRQQLQSTIRQGLSNAERIADPDRRAWALHYVAGQVYLATQPPRIGEGKTLWQRLGGEENVAKIVDDFLSRAIEDSKVNLTRKDPRTGNDRFPLDREGLTRFKTQLVYLTSAVSGGPYKYEGKSMKAAHKDMGITEAEFDALLPHLRIALLKNSVRPPDVMAIMEMIPTIRGEIVAPPMPTPSQGPQRILTLWDRLGGEVKVTAIVNDFVDLAMRDASVNFLRNGKFKMGSQQADQLKRQLVNLASQVGGGPYKYEGRSMKEVHLGMRITDAEFDALIKNLRIAMSRHEVKALEVALIVKAIELTRKDIVEDTNTGMPGTTAKPRAPANPAPSQPSPKSGGRPTRSEPGVREAARSDVSSIDATMPASKSDGTSPLGSFILAAIRQAGLEGRSAKPRAGEDHAP